MACVEGGWTGGGRWWAALRRRLLACAAGQVSQGVQELEEALTCKWVAANALSALNALYQVRQG